MIWNIPRVFSKKDRRRTKMFDVDRDTLNCYYHNDIEKLNKLLNIDLFEKWNIK